MKPISRAHNSWNRGVSLIEALVALAVMAFGMLGIVAIQASLRNNADIARQRTEAARFANEFIEEARAYSVVSTTGGKRAFDDIVTDPGTTLNGTNASYNRVVTVTDSPDFRFKTLHARVTWTDRSNVTQEVELSSVIHRTPPELAMSLAIPPANAWPLGRHPAIPPGAIDNGTTSQFTPPASAGGGPAPTWVFSNTTGVVIQTCVGAACTSGLGYLLHGRVFFATSANPATPHESEAPPDGAIPGLDVAVTLLPPPPPPPGITPSNYASPVCYLEYLPSAGAPKAVQYYCLLMMPAGVMPVRWWSGHADLVVPTAWPLASSIADASAGRYRVCRYTPHRVLNATAGTTYQPSPPPVVPPRTIYNEEHPLHYVRVGQSLVNQDFLVIRAGNGALAFDCPDDDTGTPAVNGSTWHHQPAS